MQDYSEDKSDSQSWAFTLKYNSSDNPHMTDYEAIFKKWQKKGVYIDIHTYEQNKQKSGVHCHGIVVIPKRVFRKRLCYQGWHLHLTELTNRLGWLQYINKQQHQQDETPGDGEGSGPEIIEWDLDYDYLQ